MNAARTLALVALLLAAGTAGAIAAGKEFLYQNPISEGIDPRGLRDCQVFRDGDRWYLTGTAYPVWPKEDAFGQLNPGVVLYSSTDLLKWKFERVLVRPEPTKWNFMRFWAPEIHRIDGKYYATFNCRNPNLGDNLLRVGYAVADKLEGPYRVIEQPLAKGNDLHLFQDEDGKVWAFWNEAMEPGNDRVHAREFGIGFAQIDLDSGNLLTSPQRAIRYGEEGKDWDGVGIEGSYVVKRQGTYYLFFSSWTRGYEIGYATAPAITGPWKKFSGNPIYSAQDPAACRKSGVPFTGDAKAEFSHVGHNAIFTGPNGRLWLSCHGILRADATQVPKLLLEPLDFADDGRVLIGTPSTVPKQITLP